MKKIAIFNLFILLLFVGVSIADNPHTPHAPIVVAAPTFLSQIASLPATAVFTPPVTGLYRVSAYEEVIPWDSCGCSMNVQLLWTDDNRTNAVNPLISGAYFGQGSAVVYAAANTPINISAQVTLAAGQSYNLFVIVEQL